MSEHCAVLPVAAGAILRIWLKSPLAKVQALQAERARAAEQAGVNEAAAAWHAEAASRAALEAAEQAHGVASAALNSFTQSLDQKGQEACGKIEAQINTLDAEALDLVATARAELDSLEADKRKMQQELLAKAAELESRANAAKTLAEEAAARACKQIYSLAKEAVERANIPLLGALTSKAKLALYDHGFFAILPCLAEDTGRLGMFPVKHKSLIAWQGFFVELPDCPGHAGSDIWNPDGLPPLANPTAPDNPGNGNWWIPCDHTHG